MERSPIRGFCPAVPRVRQSAVCTCLAENWYFMPTQHRTYTCTLKKKREIQFRESEKYKWYVCEVAYDTWVGWCDPDWLAAEDATTAWLRNIFHRIREIGLNKKRNTVSRIREIQMICLRGGRWHMSRLMRPWLTSCRGCYSQVEKYIWQNQRNMIEKKREIQFRES